MSQGDRLLAQGEALTRFRVSVAKEERFAEFYTGELFDKGIRHASGPQDRSFCRRVFCHTHAQRVVDASMALPLPYIAVSDADDIVSFSGFRSLPFHVQRWLATDLMAPQDGEYAFRLGTCGGVRLWCSAHLAACFAPLTRNEMQFLDIRLTLHKGKNSLLIHLDELFERDTVCALKMIYLDEKPLRVGTIKGQQLAPISIPQAPDGERLLMLMAAREYGPQVEALLYSLLKQASAREEGSVFSVLVLLQLWNQYHGDAFPDAMWRRVKSTLLGYRYWHDERGCDVMDFWREDNAVAFHTAQYLAGQYFPDARFIASSRYGHQQQQLGKARLEGIYA